MWILLSFCELPFRLAALVEKEEEEEEVRSRRRRGYVCACAGVGSVGDGGMLRREGVVGVYWVVVRVRVCVMVTWLWLWLSSYFWLLLAGVETGVGSWMQRDAMRWGGCDAMLRCNAMMRYNTVWMLDAQCSKL